MVSRRLALAAWLALGLVNAALGAPSTPETRDRLKQVKAEISQLTRSLADARKTYADEQEALRNADRDISTSAMRLRDLESTAAGHRAEMAQLDAKRERYLHTLDQRRQALARQIMAAYRLGRESRLKLVLNQDSPAQLSRMLAYYDYFSKSEAGQIGELKQVLQTLDRMQAKIDQELSALEVIKANQQTVMDKLRQQREQRRQIVARLSAQIDSDETRLAELKKNRRDLETLLRKLTSVLADIPDDLGRRLAPEQFKGKLPWPVKGRVRHAFGQPRTAGLDWQGWLIAAPTGSEVKSIGYGRVAFSDWLRGYGLLMIIDHGDGFMSLYGNNESLLHEVGDWVEPGTAISTVGESPRNGSGLYFEIRKNGKAVDPAIWINR